LLLSAGMRDDITKDFVACVKCFTLACKDNAETEPIPSPHLSGRDVPRLRFKNLDELNAWLLDQCITYAKAHRHPELTEQTI
jgi:hypothetical protein